MLMAGREGRAVPRQDIASASTARRGVRWRGRAPPHSTTANEQCPSSSTVARQNATIQDKTVTLTTARRHQYWWRSATVSGGTLSQSRSCRADERDAFGSVVAGDGVRFGRREILLLVPAYFERDACRSSRDCGQPAGEGGAHVCRHSSGQSKIWHRTRAGTKDQGGRHSDHQRCRRFHGLLRGLCAG